MLIRSFVLPRKKTKLVHLIIESRYLKRVITKRRVEIYHVVGRVCLERNNWGIKMKSNAKDAIQRLIPDPPPAVLEYFKIKRLLIGSAGET